MIRKRQKNTISRLLLICVAVLAVCRLQGISSHAEKREYVGHWELVDQRVLYSGRDRTTGWMDWDDGVRKGILGISGLEMSLGGFHTSEPVHTGDDGPYNVDTGECDWYTYDWASVDVTWDSPPERINCYTEGIAYQADPFDIVFRASFQNQKYEFKSFGDSGYTGLGMFISTRTSYMDVEETIDADKAYEKKWYKYGRDIEPDNGSIRTEAATGQETFTARFEPSGADFSINENNLTVLYIHLTTGVSEGEAVYIYRYYDEEVWPEETTAAEGASETRPASAPVSSGGSSSGNAGSGNSGASSGSTSSGTASGNTSGNVTGGSSSGSSSQSGGGSSSNGSGSPYDREDHHHEEWDHHADTFDSVWRSFIDWLAALLFGTGIGGTLGGGLGGTLGGGIGGFPGGPDSGSGEDGREGAPGGNGPGRRPWSYEDPSSVPKGWSINGDGDISYRDPVTDEYEKFELTGYDPETGEPQYINQRGLPYTESMIRENYENRSRNSENLRQDEETGKRWAEEQREKEHAKWEKERATGVTEASKGYKEDQAELKREEYLDELAWKHGKQKDDIKGIKKDILEKRQNEAKEYARQMAKDDYYGAAEKTAEQVEQASDIAIDVLGEVTGPAGKNIKNAYQFMKPGLKNLAEAKAAGKDVYDQMEAMAYGSVEGAVNVLQNEVDGVGMKVGGDVFKAGLDAYRKGEDVGAAMEAATFKSVREATIEKGFSFLGKKASDLATAGKTEKVGKLIDSAGEGGFSFKNLAGNTAKSEVVMKKAKLASDTLAQIQKTEKVLTATQTLAKDVYLAANDENLTARAEAMQARSQAARTNIERGKQIDRIFQKQNRK